jgi:hypothetical protein
MFARAKENGPCAQHLAARKFTYSRLNTWEPPSRAFERGMG